MCICFSALHRSRLLLCLVPCVVMMLTLQHLLSTSAKLQMICKIPVVAWRKILRIHWARVEKVGFEIVKFHWQLGWRKLPSNHGTKRQWFFHSSHLFWKTRPTLVEHWNKNWLFRVCRGFTTQLYRDYKNRLVFLINVYQFWHELYQEWANICLVVHVDCSANFGGKMLKWQFFHGVL